MPVASRVRRWENKEMFGVLRKSETNSTTDEVERPEDHKTIRPKMNGLHDGLLKTFTLNKNCIADLRFN